MTAVHIDLIWVTTAFLMGFGVRQAGLPPLIGFLGAGFLLKALGLTEGTLALERIGDIGVMVMLFTIGLKLHIKDLLKPEIWASTGIHTLLTVLAFGTGIYILSIAGLSVFASLTLAQSALIAFALSFSSTVFAVKILEEKGDMSARYGQIAIGVLVFQDILAVIFLTVSKGQFPSIWALGIPLFLFLIRPIIIFFMERTGRGELFSLFGLFVTFGCGAMSFEMVGLKPDLGALVIGAMIANHPRASKLSKSLMNFKDLFLIGFFFNIGMTGIPTLTGLLVAAGLALLVIFKSGLFFYLFTRFKLRARTSLLSTLALSNYSEFGLIVAAIGVYNGWLTNEWLVILALALTISFVLASPLNTDANSVYDRFAQKLKKFQATARLPGELPASTGDTEIAVFGMGRVGTHVYDVARSHFGNKTVAAMDHDKEVVNKHRREGRNVFWGDAADKDLWDQLADRKNKAIRLVVLAMPNHTANMTALKELNAINFSGKVVAMAKYDDEVEKLKEAGATLVFNLYSEVAAVFAEHVCKNYRNENPLSKGE